MRYFLLLAFVGGLLASASFAQAQPIDPDSGHIGSSLVHDKSSGFFTVDYVAAHSPSDQA